MQGMDELSSAACEMGTLIETATVPIFRVNSDGLINGWNGKIAELIGLQASEAMGKSLVNEVVHEDSRGTVENLLCRALQGEEDRNIELKLKSFVVDQPMEKLTGWRRDEVMGKMLLGDIFGSFCWLKGQDTLTEFMIFLYQGISGHDTEQFTLEFFNKDGKFVEVVITVNKRTDAGGHVIGCFCSLQIVMPELEKALEGYCQEDRECSSKLGLAYVRKEMKNPLNGISFTHRLLENTAVSEHQKQFLDTSNARVRQIMTVIEGMNFQSKEPGILQLNMKEFLLGKCFGCYCQPSHDLATREEFKAFS